jgi:hypothetical protein
MEFLDVECDQRNIIRMAGGRVRIENCRARKTAKTKTARRRAVFLRELKLLVFRPEATSMRTLELLSLRFKKSAIT